MTASTAALAVFGLLPVGVGIGQTHMARRPIGEPPDGFVDVGFRSSDGLRLSGWYTPTSNGAALVVVSGARGDRLGALQHAELLADHGYGVLLYDARGAGRSEGSPNGYGWSWKNDVTGALDFLSRQPGVDPTRLGGLGISTGADVLIEVAASDRRLAAVVSDGATIRSRADIPPSERANSLVMWPVLATVRLLSGETPGPPLATLAARVSPTPLLLIACGSMPAEITVNRIYAEAAREPVELWALPHVAHTAAIREEAADYERRVVAHFDQALLE